MKKIKQKVQGFFEFVFVSNAENEIWLISAVVLFLVLVLYALYSYEPNFNRSVNTLLMGTQQVAQTQEKLFKLPVTVVYDSSSTEQKTRMNEFLANLSDPTAALIATDVEPTWLDYKDQKAQALIQQSGLKYLPQIFLDPSIQQHPQFKALQQYLTNKGDVWFIRLAPLQNLGTPDATQGNFQGVDPTKAKVVIQAYESYACDHCAEAQATLKKIVQDYPNDVSIVYKHFEPGDVYNQVAQGAECAGDQGKFFQMQDVIFKGQPDMLKKFQSFSTAQTASPEVAAYVDTLLQTDAKNLHLNLDLFKTCMSEKTHYALIQQETLDAVDYGVNGPPSFFINQQFQNGLLSYDQFKPIIDSELKK